MALTVYYVSPDRDEWIVHETGGRVFNRHSLEGDAFEAAKKLAIAKPPSKIVAQNAEGQWVVRFIYDELQLPQRG